MASAADQATLNAASTLLQDASAYLISSIAALSHAPLPPSTLPAAALLRLAAPAPGRPPTLPLLLVWVSKLFERLDALELAGEARTRRKELLRALKELEARLEGGEGAALAALPLPPLPPPPAPRAARAPPSPWPVRAGLALAIALLACAAGLWARAFREGGARA